MDDSFLLVVLCLIISLDFKIMSFWKFAGLVNH